MSWHRNKSLSARWIAGAALLAFGAGTAAADVLVVRATGPSARSYPAGRSLGDDARIALQANDTLVLLDARGTRTLRGPGTFTPNSPVQAAAPRTMIAANTGQRRARIGAVRNVTQTAMRSPSIWHLDVSKSTNYCLADPANVMLWRPDAARAETLTVARLGGASRELRWAPGQATMAWPADIEARDGAEYRLSLSGAPAPATIKIRTVADPTLSLNDMAATLIKQGCTAQLDLLIETVRLPDDGSTPTG